MSTALRPAALAVLAAVALTLAGCDGSGRSSGTAAAAGFRAGSAAGSAGEAVASDAHGKAGTASTGKSVDVAAIEPRVVRTAQVVVQVQGALAAAAARVRAVAQSLGGTLSTETTTYADTGQTTTTTATGATAATAGTPPARPALPGESVLVLRVPEPDLDKALTLLTGTGGVGKELSRSATAEDVTADLADLQSRVATQRASVTRVRALLARATSLQEVVTIESELTRRESDLEAAEARQATLADRADFATLTVDLRTPEVVPPPPSPNAFLDGLASGWQAVTASTTVVLTVLGALLPVAVVLAAVGAPVLWWTRRRRGVRPPVPATPAPDPGI